MRFSPSPLQSNESGQSSSQRRGSRPPKPLTTSAQVSRCNSCGALAGSCGCGSATASLSIEERRRRINSVLAKTDFERAKSARAREALILHEGTARRTLERKARDCLAEHVAAASITYLYLQGRALISEEEATCFSILKGHIKTLEYMREQHIAERAALCDRCSRGHHQLADEEAAARESLVVWFEGVTLVLAELRDNCETLVAEEADVRRRLTLTLLHELDSQLLIAQKNSLYHAAEITERKRDARLALEREYAAAFEKNIKNSFFDGFQLIFEEAMATKRMIEDRQASQRAVRAHLCTSAIAFIRRAVIDVEATEWAALFCAERNQREDAYNRTERRERDQHAVEVAEVASRVEIVTVEERNFDILCRLFEQECRKIHLLAAQFAAQITTLLDFERDERISIEAEYYNGTLPLLAARSTALDAISHEARLHETLNAVARDEACARSCVEEDAEWGLYRLQRSEAAERGVLSVTSSLINSSRVKRCAEEEETDRFAILSEEKECREKIFFRASTSRSKIQSPMVSEDNESDEEVISKLKRLRDRDAEIRRACQFDLTNEILPLVEADTEAKIPTNSLVLLANLSRVFLAVDTQLQHTVEIADRDYERVVKTAGRLDREVAALQERFDWYKTKTEISSREFAARIAGAKRDRIQKEKECKLLEDKVKEEEKNVALSTEELEEIKDRMRRSLQMSQSAKRTKY